MITLIRTVRPGGTLLYLPGGIAARLQIIEGRTLTSAQWCDREVQALIASRTAANAAKKTCDHKWHRENRYT